MQIVAAIEYDRLRQEPGTWNKVILHREGKFYRAYEWSAWLIKTVVSTDKEWLLSLIPQIDCFLQERLHLQLHRGKTQLREVSQGVEFLGGFVKPHRTYMSHHAEQRLRRSVERLPMNKPDKLFRSVNAMLGVLAHYDSYRLRHELFDTDAFHRVGYFDSDMTQFFLR